MFSKLQVSRISDLRHLKKYKVSISCLGYLCLYFEIIHVPFIRIIRIIVCFNFILYFIVSLCLFWGYLFSWLANRWLEKDQTHLLHNAISWMTNYHIRPNFIMVYGLLAIMLTRHFLGQTHHKASSYSAGAENQLPANSSHYFTLLCCIYVFLLMKIKCHSWSQ